MKKIFNNLKSQKNTLFNGFYKILNYKRKKNLQKNFYLFLKNTRNYQFINTKYLIKNYVYSKQYSQKKFLNFLKYFNRFLIKI